MTTRSFVRMMVVGMSKCVGVMVALISVTILHQCGVAEGCFGVNRHHLAHSKATGQLGRHPIPSNTVWHVVGQATLLRAKEERLQVTSSSSSLLESSEPSRLDSNVGKPRPDCHSSRRQWFEQAAKTSSSLALLSSSLLLPLGWLTHDSSSWADDSGMTGGSTTFISAAAAVEEFVGQGPDYGYSIRLPSPFTRTQKPLKTHLDEINFVSPTVKGYQVGITVDPVRINSLREFGTPEEVAAKVVLAEVNRDGVVNVTLVKDPVEVQGGGYQLDYLSQGSRGDKHFVVHIEIQRQKLYVVTAQAPEQVFPEVAPELTEFVSSFRLL